MVSGPPKTPQWPSRVPGGFSFLSFKPLHYVSKDSLWTPDFNVMDAISLYSNFGGKCINT